MRAIKNTMLLLAAITPLALSACRGHESDQPPIHIILNMDTQEKGKAYRQDDTGLFANGRVMQAPVEGTVAQGDPLGNARYEEGLDEIGDPTLKFPDEVKQDGVLAAGLAARGQQRYDIYCSPCHGYGLDGKGVMTEPSLDSNQRLVVPPPSFHSKRLKNMPVGQMYAAIKHGVNDGNMGSYAAQIPLDDRWAIIAYIRDQQKQRDANVEIEGGKVMKVGPIDVASADVGSQLYEAKGCVACHTLDGGKLVGPSFKGLWGKSEQTSAGDVVVDMAYVMESIESPAAKIVTGYPPAMPKLPLSKLEIESLALYIESVK